MSDFMAATQTYYDYVKEPPRRGLSQEVAEIRSDLAQDMMSSPDYHADAKRNGNQQGFIFTRGGEQHSYNVICLPGDELYAGDEIDAFGEKWIVMEARADDTTHRTGVMFQCNRCMRFQNFDKEIHERWCYIKASGYSSAFNRDEQIVKSADQMAIYMSYDEATEKIFVDKRLPVSVAYDKRGQMILEVVKVTGVLPFAGTFNTKDHLLMLKVERDLFKPDIDNVELEICDFISEDQRKQEETEAGSCVIIGSSKLRVGKSQTYRAEFCKADGTIADGASPLWSMSAEDGVTLSIEDGDAVVSAANDKKLIGGTFILSLSDAEGKYGTAELEGEVTSLV